MNSSPSFVAKLISALAFSAVVGCGGSSDGKRLAKGIDAYRSGDLVEASRCFAKTIELNGDNADALFWSARVKLDLGELKDASSFIERARNLAGDDADILDLKAQIAFHLKDYAAATACYQAVAENLELEPKIRSRALAGLGVVLQVQDQSDAARIAFLKAINLDRRNAEAWYHLALIYRDVYGFYEAALEHFEFFIRIREVASPRVQKVQRVFIPELKETIARALANIDGVDRRDRAASAKALQEGEKAWKKSHFKTARLRFNDAYLADPLSFEAAVNLARAWEKVDTSAAGRKEALGCYRAACRLSPSSISTFLAAGELALKVGANASAVEIYSRAMAADPKNSNAITGIVNALTKCGRNEVAKIYKDYLSTLSKRKR